MKQKKILMYPTIALAGWVLAMASPIFAVVWHTGGGTIDGSLCVGFDCPANPAFGFDTIRLQENNLRIHFDDTSVAAAFPPNDWRIIINDSANGGASHFTIEDATAGRNVFRVFAGARSNALVVDSQGDVGVGTATPATDIHIKTGNTPTLRLEQDGSAGFTPQSWDVAGNETNFFIRDATNGSTLPFRIQPGAASNVIYIASDEEVGINTSNPADDLHIVDNGPARLRLTNTASTGVNDWSFNSNNTLRISADADAAEFILDGDGDLTILGALTTATTTYPDYVFEAGYPLMPIAELGAFIEENGHLPNISSFADVDGGRKVNLSQLGVQLLEKVEELTLYTLQQQDTIDQLKAEIASLRQEDG